MAVTIVTIFQGVDTSIKEVSFTTAGDSFTITVPHGLGSAPAEVYLVPMGGEIAFGQPAFYDNRLAIESIGGTNVIVAGAGLVAPSTNPVFRVITKRPHTIGR